MFALRRPKIRGLLPEVLAQSDPTPVDLSIGDIRSQIAAEWLQIAQQSQWRAYRKPPSLFRIVQSLTPFDLPFPPNGDPYAPRYTNGHISATGDPVHFVFGSRVVGFSGSVDRMEELFLVTSWIISNVRICATGDPIHLYSARGLCDSTAFLLGRPER